MNEIVAELLAQHYSSLNYVTRAAGCVTQMTKPRKGKPALVFPVATHVYVPEGENATVCDNQENFYDVSPNSKEAGIVFFEDLGSRVIDRNHRSETWEGKLKLVFWANLKLIGEQDKGALQASILSHLPTELSPVINFLGGRVRATKTFPKYPTAFNAYRYDEDQVKYLSAPYDSFAVEIIYTARAIRGCALNVVLNPAIC